MSISSCASKIQKLAERLTIFLIILETKMNLHEYHRLFAGESFDRTLEKYNELDIFPDIVGNSIYYCCIPGDMDLGSTQFCRGLVESIGKGFHPNVTPEMAANFLVAHNRRRIPTAFILKFHEYEKIYEAIGILISKAKYYALETTVHVCIERNLNLTSDRCFRIDRDQFIFIMDIVAKQGYPLSMRYDISIDYFGENEELALNKHVTAYKQLCIENTKTC